MWTPPNRLSLSDGYLVHNRRHDSPEGAEDHPDGGGHEGEGGEVEVAVDGVQDRGEEEPLPMRVGTSSSLGWDQVELMDK